MNNNYTASFTELQQIANEIEKGTVSIDALSEKVNRAAVLIKICRDKLSTTEEDINQILKDIAVAS